MPLSAKSNDTSMCDSTEEVPNILMSLQNIFSKQSDCLSHVSTQLNRLNKKYYSDALGDSTFRERILAEEAFPEKNIEFTAGPLLQENKILDPELSTIKSDESTTLPLGYKTLK